MAETTLDDAAILLMAIGEDAASAVFKQLSPREAELLGKSMAQLKGVADGEVADVLSRFQQQAGQTVALVADNEAYVKGVLQRALGDDRARTVMSRIAPKNESPALENLKWLDADSVAALISAEHPQIIALILAHLDSDQAAAILRKIDANLRNDAILRMATLSAVQPSALRELDDVLAGLIVHSREPMLGAMGGTKLAADILNRLGSSVEKEVLDAIREMDEDLATQIGDQMFIFADLTKLDDKGVQALLREIQTDSLVVALKGADKDLVDRICKNMSQRAAETLREDLSSKGPVRLSEVEEQQREILSTLRRLAEEGQIQLASGGDDAFV
jgi:flagellar motor switch protein FliG